MKNIKLLLCLNNISLNTINVIIVDLITSISPALDEGHVLLRGIIQDAYH